jgi:hypothetical protein
VPRRHVFDLYAAYVVENAAIELCNGPHAVIPMLIEAAKLFKHIEGRCLETA